MKKLAVIITLGSMLCGCMTDDTLKTLKEVVFEEEINTYVELNYPVERIELQFLKPTVYEYCSDAIKVNQLSLVKIKLNNETRYVLKSSVNTEPLKRCVDNYLSQRPISNEAMEKLITNPAYEEYRFEPDVRKVIDKAKSDNVISYREQKEILDIVKDKRLNRLKIENKIWYQEKIHDL
ncbi:hypothetical protein [Acinetobacter seifertii]|uniref:hypothetical protein n=1 Tax=Acinetobacter seifertii TaxID=1530123 RepID=UPI000C21DD02|nr:hypothetical protein [Acinetobacter seifertii]PJG65687.1 hypothetical protein CVD09_15065 [Acinetobacter seifertii]